MVTRQRARPWRTLQIHRRPWSRNLRKKTLRRSGAEQRRKGKLAKSIRHKSSGEAKISEKPKDSAGENTQQVFWPAAVATRGRSRRGARGAAKRGKSRDRRHKGGRDQAKETGEVAPAVSQPEDLGWPTAKITTSPAASAQEAIAAWDAFAAPDLAKTTSKPDEMKNDSAANQSRKGSVAVSSALGVWGTDQQKKADSPPSPPTLPIPSKQNSSSSVDLPPSVQAATPVEEDGPKPGEFQLFAREIFAVRKSKILDQTGSQTQRPLRL
ncbi:hypothetical protein FOZ60_009026 [Perkinsus olseni]|uniref:Uncharacterized protein n=1 Tax=Perkinsus olseni TaxID=32597 RepID=A0A7J6NHX3_PEROL|nr:hypothetical protein FOZ60_009026 [Perkinsus olseni]